MDLLSKIRQIERETDDFLVDKHVAFAAIFRSSYSRAYIASNQLRFRIEEALFNELIEIEIPSKSTLV